MFSLPRVMNPLEHVGVALSGEHIGGAHGTVESVAALVTTMRSSDVIQTTAKLMMAIEAVEGGGIAGVQERLATGLYPSKASSKLLRLLALPSDEGGVDVLFYPQQLMALQKVALAVGQQGPPTSFDNRTRWGEFLLAAALITDVIQTTSDFPKTGISARQRERELATFWLRNAEANRLTFYRATAGRAFSMWMDSRCSWPDDLNHPDDFCVRQFGVPVSLFMAICLAPAYARVNARDPSPQEAVFDPSVYFRNSGLDVEQAVSVLDQLTYPDRLPPETVNLPSTYWLFTDFAERPYLRSSRTTLVPASVSRAFERGTTGIFWLLHAAMRNRGDDVTDLTNHFGHIFEDYCLRVAEHSAGPSTNVEGELEYLKTRRDRVKSVDILVSSLGRAAPCRVFIECAAIRPTQPLFEKASLEAFDSYVGRIVDKLRQIDRSISDHRADHFELTNDLARPDDTYIPLLVVDEPFQWSVHLRNVLDQRVNPLGLFSGVDVARPVICDIGEFEHLWSYVERGGSIGDSLLGYLSETDRTVSLEHYLFDSGELLGSPSFVDRGFETLSEMLITELQLSDP